MDIMLTWPRSIKRNEYCFKLNTDDFPDAKKVSEHLRKKGIEYKKTKTYSDTKLMGWHVYKIPAPNGIESFSENVRFCEELFKDFVK